MAELTAAKIVAEAAGPDRFKSKDAYARHNGTTPLPVWSGNRTGTGWPAPATASSTAPSTAGLSLPWSSGAVEGHVN